MGSRDEVALWEVTHGYLWLPMGRQLVGLPRWGGEEASCTQRFPMKLEPMRVVVFEVFGTVVQNAGHRGVMD